MNKAAATKYYQKVLYGVRYEQFAANSLFGQSSFYKQIASAYCVFESIRL